MARAFLKADGWKVRGITRNLESKSAKALANEGAEMTVANIDDEASLVKAFEVSEALSTVRVLLTGAGRSSHLLPN